MEPGNSFEDIPELLGLQIKENEDIKQSLRENDGKFDKLLAIVEEMKKSSPNSSSRKKYSEKDLSEVQNEIRKTAAEHDVIKKQLSNSTNILKSLADRIEAVDQYIKRENLFLDLDGIKIPYHLKGYKFSQWLAKLLNKLIPSLDFPILPWHISVSHPLSPNSSRVIARFAVRDVRNEIFYKRMFITNPNVTVTEHLTAQNLNLLKIAQNLLGASNAWSSQTKLYGKAGREVCRINCRDDIDLLLGMKLSFDQLLADRFVDPVAVPQNRAAAPPTNTNCCVNLSPINDSEDIISSWPYLSQSTINSEMSNFFNRDKLKRRPPVKSGFRDSKKTRNRPSKRFVIPPPIHRSYS